MWTLSAITVFTHFCLRYKKDKERFEVLFIFCISKKTIDIYVKYMLCGHFSQNILISYIRPCFKWFSGNVFFIRFHIRAKNIRHVFKKWRVLDNSYLNGYRIFVSCNVVTLGNMPIPTDQEHSLDKKTEIPHMFWLNISRRPGVMSVSQKHQKLLKLRALQKYPRQVLRIKLKNVSLDDCANEGTSLLVERIR